LFLGGFGQVTPCHSVASCIVAPRKSGAWASKRAKAKMVLPVNFALMKWMGLENVAALKLAGHTDDCDHPLRWIATAYSD
jgi:hypothetical protein